MRGPSRTRGASGRAPAGRTPIGSCCATGCATFSSRNKRYVGDALQDLSQRLGFRCIEGLAERVIFREFYPRGLTAVDDLDELTLGTRPTMSHVTAQLEVQGLLASLLAAPTRAADGFDQANAA